MLHERKVASCITRRSWVVSLCTEITGIVSQGKSGEARTEPTLPCRHASLPAQKPSFLLAPLPTPVPRFQLASAVMQPVPAAMHPCPGRRTACLMPCIHAWAAMQPLPPTFAMHLCLPLRPRGVIHPPPSPFEPSQPPSL
eukprot:363986-Chlamydomonas_euryale.AAC.2